MTLIILTQRLTLKPLTLEEAPAFHALTNDFDVLKMTASLTWPFTLQDAENLIRNKVGNQGKAGHLFGIYLSEQNLAATLPENKTPPLMGAISLFKTDNPNKDAPMHFTLGYHLGKNWWGKGYVSEAVRALLDWSSEHWGTQIIIGAGHYPDNPASGRILTKNGFCLTHQLSMVYCRARKKMMPSMDYEWCFKNKITP